VAYFQYLEKISEAEISFAEDLYPKQTPIPLRMTPIGAFWDHLHSSIWGTAGVNVCGTDAEDRSDNLTRFFSYRNDRRLIFNQRCWQGGFASVFGTPIAGAFSH